MTAYYNEKDPFAAAWLRNLIAANMIAPGDVDERSIEDVIPLELDRYTQCHFFAGIGVWSYSMRRADWPDDRHGWTGSCPCQPFSQAGQGAGFADERHLWPAFYHLIEQCGPDIVFGEQVASPDGLAWLDLVQSDMETANYAFGAHVTPAAGCGAPHIRHRTYWAAYADNARSQGRLRVPERGNQFVAGPYGMAGGLADAAQLGRRERSADVARCGERSEAQGLEQRPRNGSVCGFDGSGPTNGFWSAADWLRCRDDKWRPVEPGTFPLAHGTANRVGRLRGYGNAIVAPQAEEFIRAAMAYAP